MKFEVEICILHKQLHLLDVLSWQIILSDFFYKKIIVILNQR